MGLVLRSRLQAENIELQEENMELRKSVDYWTKKCFEIADMGVILANELKGVILANELKKYKSLGSIEYLRKLVEADKK